MKVYEIVARVEGENVRITRAWGRDGASELARMDLVCTLARAPRLLELLEARRARRGYVVTGGQCSIDSCEREIRWTAASGSGAGRVSRRQLGFAFP